MAIKGRTIGAAGGAGGALVLALVLITGFEGRVHEVYPDPVTKGAPWTYCDGETQRPRWDHVYTDEECDAETLALVVKVDRDIMACMGHPLPDAGPTPPPLPDKVRASFVSLAWNIGTGAFCGATLVKKVKASQLAAACREMLKWNKAGGKTIPGLTFRRGEEYKICLDGVDEQ